MASFWQLLKYVGNFWCWHPITVVFTISHLGQLFLSTPFICFVLCIGTQYIIDTPMPCTEYINRVDVYLKVLLHTSFLLHSLVYGGFSCQWVFYPFFFLFYPFLIFNFLYIFLFDRQGSNTFRVNQQKIFDKLFWHQFFIEALISIRFYCPNSQFSMVREQCM